MILDPRQTKLKVMLGDAAPVEIDIPEGNFWVYRTMQSEIVTDKRNPAEMGQGFFVILRAVRTDALSGERKAEPKNRKERRAAALELDFDEASGKPIGVSLMRRGA